MTNFLYRVMRHIVQFYFNIKYKITVYNREKLPPKYTGGYIIACNHQKYADPPAIAAVVKGRFSFMAKEELFKGSPLFAALIKMCGAFPVVRGAKDNAAIERAVADLKKGRIFVIFPEGTRSKDGVIGKAKSGAALIASMAGAPVLPVCIMYALGGKKTLDLAVGDFIEPSEIKLTEESGGAPDRAELKRVSERIIGDIKALQAQIFTERKK